MRSSGGGAPGHQVNEERKTCICGLAQIAGEQRAVGGKAQRFKGMGILRCGEHMPITTAVGRLADLR